MENTGRRYMEMQILRVKEYLANVVVIHSSRDGERVLMKSYEWELLLDKMFCEIEEFEDKM